MTTKEKKFLSLIAVFKQEEIDKQLEHIDQIDISFIPMICQIGNIGYNLESAINLTDRIVHLANHFSVRADLVYGYVERGLSLGESKFINHAFSAAEKKLRRDNNKRHRQAALKGQLN